MDLRGPFVTLAMTARGNLFINSITLLLLSNDTFDVADDDRFAITLKANVNVKVLQVSTMKKQAIAPMSLLTK